MSYDLSTLEKIIAASAKKSPEDSYTAQLLAKGVEQCAQKLGEEAVECVIAAVQNDTAELTKEAADLLYHLLVTLKSNDISLESVYAELEQRIAQSGLDEKASRTK